jgi:hypothetical protein
VLGIIEHGTGVDFSLVKAAVAPLCALGF